MFTEDLIVSGWTDSKIRCNRADNAERKKYIYNLALWTMDNAHRNGVTAVTMSKNNRFICSGGNDGEVRIWEMKSKDMLSHLKEHIQGVTKVQLFNSDRNLLSTAKDKSILIWDLNTERRVASYQQSAGGVNNFQFRPTDENTFVTVGQDRKITQFDLRLSKAVKIISSNPYNKPEFADELFGLAFTNDGQHLATGGTLGIIRIYDVNNGLQFIKENNAHSNTCNALAFTYDDKYLISAGADSQIFLFKVFNE
jgi:WD40 repeat protein